MFGVDGQQQDWRQRVEAIRRRLARPTGLAGHERTELEIELLKLERLIAARR